MTKRISKQELSDSLSEALAPPKRRPARAIDLTDYDDEPEVTRPPAVPVHPPNRSEIRTRPQPEPVAAADRTLSPKRTRLHSEPVQHTDGHMQITNHLLDDILPTLEPQDQVVLLRIYRLTRGYRKASCRVSRYKLIAKTGVKKTRLLQSLALLEDRGLIRRLADDTSNPNLAERGMNIEILLEGVEPVRNTNPFAGRTRPASEPNKLNTQKESTQTQDKPAAVVRVGSKFSIEECRRYAKHLQETGQGINNPGGYATTIHRTGEADELIERFLNPPTTTLVVDASQCPDCKGSGFYYPNGTTGGVAKCKHETLSREGK